MKVPTRNKHGYPTDETLATIKDWPIEDGFPALIEYLREAWRYSDRFNFRERGGRLTLNLSTGGWSGNEEIVDALAESLFWLLYWQSSKRGGHYVFEGEILK